MSEPLLNTAGLAAELGLHPDTLSRLKKTEPGYVKQFEVPRPVGQKRYSPDRVQQFKRGESLVRIGKGSRS